MVYEKNTIEFVQVAFEFCALLEGAENSSLSRFVDKAVKIIPLLYLKATLLPEIAEPESDDEAEHQINEMTYNAIRYRLSELFGEHDEYLETFHPDIQFSDTPIAMTVSESLADVYQAIGNFLAMYRTENEDVMVQALYECRRNFMEYWGQTLLNALKALHGVYVGLLEDGGE